MPQDSINDARFAFGENWRSFLARLDGARIAEAETALQWLVGRSRFDGLRFLDVGSGSGLSSLAARRLGANVVSFDYDVQSVDCTTQLRAKFFPNDAAWRVELGTILDRDYVAAIGQFDVVHAWGVLHHTGDLLRSIKNAALLVVPGGLLITALYRKTALCPLWAVEKRWYSRTSSSSQAKARDLYTGLMRLAFAVTGRDFAAYVSNYRSNRGMDFIHDVHDWLGGYPYESIRPNDAAQMFCAIGFEEIRTKVRGNSIGVFGSGCDEYVYRKRRD